MNYFTRQRYLALQERGNDAMHAADAAWDEAVQRSTPTCKASVRRCPNRSVNSWTVSFSTMPAC